MSIASLLDHQRYENPNNLPASLTSFIGRRREMATIANLLGDRQRLVTLLGSGGVGKTRLALESAAELVDSARFPDGVWFIDLAPVTESRAIVSAAAAVFGLQEEAGRALVDVLLDALRARRLLLIVDNCEQVVQGCAELVHATLRACPRLAVLATSREPLGVLGEYAVRVPSLDPPEAVRLFVDRAGATAGGFEMTEHNASAVREICARLDGIPLALELAAARTRALSVEQIAARLDNCFNLLDNGSRTAPSRQQTLEATVAWSYDLLPADEARLFERLAVFNGGWSLEAAETICADSQQTPTPVLNLLARLIDRSLVVVDDGPGGAKWYRLQETLRRFAADRLRERGDEDAMRDRHLEWYAEFASQADYALRWQHGVAWHSREVRLLRVERELANLRGACDWAARGEARGLDAGLRLAAALFPFWYVTGYLSEGLEWLRRLLSRSTGSQTVARAWALASAAKLSAHHGDDDAASRFAGEYFELPEHLWAGPATALAHTALGLVALRQGELSAARAHASTALATSRASGELSASMYPPYLAAVAIAEGHLDEAQALYEQGLAEAEAEDFQLAAGLAFEGLAAVARARGDRGRAVALYENALATLRAIGGMPQTVGVLLALGELALEHDELDQARVRYADALQLAATLGHRQLLLGSLEGTARFLVRAGGARPSTAGRLRQAVDRLRDGVDASMEEAIELARAALAETESVEASTREAAVVPMLTRREREVVELLARGQTNREIAEALVISERTTEMHVSNVLGKLGFTSRAQVAVWAATRGTGQTG